jgi:hypothetical protein
VVTLDDMVTSYQRIKEMGFEMSLSVGQHTNDKELFYYAMIPSGFGWEVGWNPTVVNETTWEPITHPAISIWGHTPEGQTVIDKLNQFALAAKSLLRHEGMVAALSVLLIADD